MTHDVRRSASGAQMGHAMAHSLCSETAFDGRVARQGSVLYQIVLCCELPNCSSKAAELSQTEETHG
eukprot:5151795-Pleurochrysis_carterae.AAC.1